MAPSEKDDFEPSHRPLKAKLLRSCALLVLVEIACVVVGTICGAVHYLPGSIDGWFYFSLLVFGIGGALCGLILISVFLLFSEWVHSGAG